MMSEEISRRDVIKSVGLGVLAERFPLPASFWFVLVVYPVWGVAQQFALQNLVARHLTTLVPRRRWRIAAAAALFSASHFPDSGLMILTLAAGVLLTYIYERHRNLWAVGLMHGWLGAMAYYLALGRGAGTALARWLT